jgi:hypothetical protein
MTKTKEAKDAAPENGGPSKSEWLKGAKPLALQVEGQTVIATPRVFSSGSCGYNASGKVQVGDDRIQVGGNLVIIGSKEWAD